MLLQADADRTTHTAGQSSRCSSLEPDWDDWRGKSFVPASPAKVRLRGVSRSSLRLTLPCAAANEFSLFMLICSAFILNSTVEVNEFALHPYLHSFSNSRSIADLLSPVLIPDVLPGSIDGGPADFSFAAGDFLQIYRSPSEAASWDSLVTCFFIDTARNVVDYIEMIWRLLKPGGTWVNCGPTLWHFENSSEGASSVELTLDDVKALARRVGFVVEVSGVSRCSVLLCEAHRLTSAVAGRAGSQDKLHVQPFLAAQA